MPNIVGYIVHSGHLKVGGKWYAKGEVIRDLAKPVARELIKAGRIVVLEKPSDGLQQPKEPVDPPKEQNAPKVVVDPPGDPEPPKEPGSPAEDLEPTKEPDLQNKPEPPKSPKK